MSSSAAGRLPECVERWPECESGAYDPRCCRFPKSCSCNAPDESPAASALGYEGAFLQPTEYLRFEPVANPGKKTAKWDVISQRSLDTLGRIEWYGPWRQYAFRPAGGTIYNYECLFDLQDRIATCNRWHRNILANRRAVA